MGAGGCMSVDTPLKKKDVSARVPTAKPPFTLSQLKKAIPPHCFQRSILKSFSYTISDLTIVSILYYLATTYIPLLPHPFLQYFIAWPIYWAAQGCFLTGVWVIAHECGHQAFSDYGLLNDIVGYILHTALLAPYYSWKYSHRRHHSNTASLEHDEVYVPRPKSKIAPIYKYLNNPPGRFLTLFVSLTMGWPLYLAFNVSGRSYDRWASHFDPYGPIYNGRERFNIFITDLGFLAVLYAVFRMMVARGVGWVLCVYGVPVLVTNGFLVLITYLQHTHISLPHYDSSEWNWLRGALSTVDRDFGVLNKVFHNITDTHVTHHLFSNMPHYHAMEATKAMLPILGDYYQFDGTPFYKAMWREARECIYVEPDEGSEEKGVFWYRSKF